MSENGMTVEMINFDNRADNEVEYHFNVDVQVLIDHITGNVSMGWSRPGSVVSEIWRRDAGLYPEE